MLASSVLDQKDSVVFTINSECAVSECIEVFFKENVGALVIVSNEAKLLGIVSERDVLRSLHKLGVNVLHEPVSRIMTSSSRIVVGNSDDTLESLMHSMTNKRVRHIPILDDQEIIGIISIGDLVKALLDEAREENREMRQYMAGMY